MARLTYSVNEAADVLGISPWLVRQLCAEGKLPHYRWHKRLVIPKDALAAHMAKAAS